MRTHQQLMNESVQAKVAFLQTNLQVPPQSELPNVS